MFLLAFSVGFELPSALCTCMHTVDASAWLPEPSTSPRHLNLGPIGEFGGFGFIGVLLTSSLLFAAIIASIRPFYACVHVHNASALFQAFWAPLGGFGLAAGKFDFLQSSWDCLTRSGMSVALLGSSATLSVHVHASDTSVELSSRSGSPTHSSAPVAGSPGFFMLLRRLQVYFRISLAALYVRARMPDTSVWCLGLSGSMRGFAPLAGKSRVADAFAGLLELSASPWACMCALCVPGQLPSPSVFSRHDVLLLVGKSGGFGSVGPVLTCSCVYPAVFVRFSMPCVCAHDPQKKRPVYYLCAHQVCQVDSASNG